MYFYKKTLTIPKGKRLLLLPLGDVQGENQLGRLDRLITWCMQQEKKGHLVRFMLLGDYFETYSPSERARKAGANFHETTLETIHAGVKAQADDFVHRLARMRGRVLTVLQGHHWEHVKLNGRLLSSDQYIAESLDAEYAGDGMCLHDLLINGFEFRVLTMHGYGNARLDSGKLLKRLRMRDVVLNANVYWMGHDNSKVGDPLEPLLVKNGGLGYLKQYFGGIGSFQDAYHINKLETSYAEKLALSPTALGVTSVKVKVIEEDGKKRLDYEMRI